nr:EAL domain-containing protein [uncultured Undibacterium sp.]
MSDNTQHDDALFFVEDDTIQSDVSENTQLPAWNILIIDDDPDVHTATKFALNGLKIQNRNLCYLHAYSASEARHLLLHSEAIAVILLDVVMTDDDAGLQLVSYIRHTLLMKDVRIILRTGQAGYAPEMEAIRDYDINDYKNKTELTQAKLFTTVTSAIRSYEQICTISSNKLGLEAIIKASARLMALSDIQEFAETILEQVLDLILHDADAFICAINFADFSQNGEDPSKGAHIIASKGKYQDWNNQRFVQVAERKQQAMVQKALFDRNHVYDVDSVVLYFSNNESVSMGMYFDTGFNMTTSQIRLLNMFCSNASVCLENVALSSRMHNLAFFDPLTGLSNRLHLLQTLSASLRSHRKYDSVLVLVDIDHFSETNDALGHQFGDFLLCAVARRLIDHFGDACQIARIGNDIFGMLGHEEMVAPEMILSLFTKPFLVDGQRMQISVSLGLIKLSDYELQAADALKDANIALKRAKIHNRSRYTYFTKDLGVEIRERVRMMHGLRAAFERDRLFVVYQPQVNMQTGKTMGAEALLRWRTEDGSFIPPDQFIPIAEYSGLIVNIGEWVLRSACFEWKLLSEHADASFRIAVNVSQTQFSHPLFLQSVERAVVDSNIPPDRLELEITESMAMTDPEALIESIAKLKAMGVRVSIDDFGTGFSSLSHLQKLKVDKLKIDRTFVNQMSSTYNDAGIARMIVQLSQSLNIDVIAEGVETQKQADLLMSFGCVFAQGFFYSKPQTPEDFKQWLRSAQIVNH